MAFHIIICVCRDDKLLSPSRPTWHLFSTFVHMFDKLISYSSEYITQSCLKGGWNQGAGGGVTGRAEELPSTQLTDQQRLWLWLVYSSVSTTEGIKDRHRGPSLGGSGSETNRGPALNTGLSMKREYCTSTTHGSCTTMQLGRFPESLQNAGELVQLCTCTQPPRMQRTCGFKLYSAVAVTSLAPSTRFVVDSSSAWTRIPSCIWRMCVRRNLCESQPHPCVCSRIHGNMRTHVEGRAGYCVIFTQLCGATLLRISAMGRCMHLVFPLWEEL